MIIAGNSYVSMFQSGQLFCKESNESVKIKWVGALSIEHFFKNHPLALKVKELFESESDWRFISIGMHDKFALYRYAKNQHYGAFLEDLLDKYKMIFSEFGMNQKFGWIVSPQALKGLSYMGMDKKLTIEISNSFDNLLTNWCNDNDILVINPVKKLISKDGFPRDDFLQVDQIHLNEKASKYYIEDIQSKTTKSLFFLPNNCPSENIIEPATEVESFSLLVANEIGITWDNTNFPPGTRNRFEKNLIEYLSQALKVNSDVRIDRKTLLSSLNLNSMDLVELYTYATKLFGINYNFNVYLKDLKTVEQFSDFFYKNKPLSKNDFYSILAPDSSDEIQYSEILFSDLRISCMSENQASTLKTALSTQYPGNDCPYGVAYFWFALIEARKHNFANAVVFLKKATDKDLKYPFNSKRISYYEGIWKDGLNAMSFDEVKFYQNNDNKKLSIINDIDKMRLISVETLFLINECPQNLLFQYLDKFKSVRKIFLFVELLKYTNISQKIQEFQCKNDIEIDIFPYITPLSDAHNDFLLVDKIAAAEILKNLGNIRFHSEIDRIELKASSLINLKQLDVLADNREEKVGAIFNFKNRNDYKTIQTISDFVKKSHLVLLDFDDMEFDNEAYLIDIKKICTNIITKMNFIPPVHNHKARGKLVFLNNKVFYENSDQFLKTVKNESDTRKIESINQGLGLNLFRIATDLLKNQGSIHDILYSLKMTLQIIPNHSLALYYLAATYWKINYLAEAEQLFIRSLNSDPSNKNVIESFIQFYNHSGKFDRAKELSDRYKND